MKTLTIDIVGQGIQHEDNPVSCTVRGEIQIDTGDPQMDERIWLVFNAANLEAYMLLGGEIPLTDP